MCALCNEKGLYVIPALDLANEMRMDPEAVFGVIGVDDSISFRMDSGFSLEALYRRALSIVGFSFDWSFGHCDPLQPYVMHKGKFGYVKRDLPLSAFTDDNGLVDAFFVLNGQAGDIYREDGLRFYMNSREGNRHNTPHVHVDYCHESSAVLSILDGSVLAGDKRFPSKKLRQARAWVKENRVKLADDWNRMTDGIFVDINVENGIADLVLCTSEGRSC